MYGTSYSGFNSLQLATERPPALKAIVSIFASDDRFARRRPLQRRRAEGGRHRRLPDLHGGDERAAARARASSARGGARSGSAASAGPSPGCSPGSRTRPTTTTGGTGSAREDNERIEAATMLVGGWADGYTNICLRSFPELACPEAASCSARGRTRRRRRAVPGPNIDLVAEMLRWWDRWLKGDDNGIDVEPPIVVYQQRSTRPDPLRAEVRGEWRVRADVAAGAARAAPLAARGRGAGRARHGATGARATRYTSAATSARPRGSRARPRCHGASPRTNAPTKRTRSRTRGRRSRTTLVDLGHPMLRVRVTSDVRSPTSSAKVCDVFPDGAVIARRPGHAEPRAPGSASPRRCRASRWTSSCTSRRSRGRSRPGTASASTSPAPTGRTRGRRRRRPRLDDRPRVGDPLSSRCSHGPPPVDAPPDAPAVDRPQVDPRASAARDGRIGG